MPDSTLTTSIVIGAALGSTFKSAFQSAGQHAQRLGDTLKKATLGASISGGVVTLRKELTSLQRRQKRVGDSTGELGREIQRVNRRYEDAKRQAREYGIKVGDAARQHRRFTQTARQAEQALGRLQRRQERRAQRQALHSRALPLVGAAYAAAGPAKAAIEFESVMADVRKVVNFETPQQFAAMGKDILALSTRIPMTAEGIGQIVAQAGQAGIARGELLRFADDAAKMGVAFDLSGAEAGGMMTGLRTIFKLNQDEVLSLGDAYNHLSNNMDATARDILNVSNRTGSTAQLMGFSGQQVGALASTFLALKTPPEVAATGINALMLKLGTADKQGKKFQDALAGIGLSASDLKQSIKQDAQGALLSFLEAVAGSEDVTGTLADLFGMEYSDDIAKLVGSLGEYRKALGLVAKETNFAGSMGKEYEERAKTTANELQLMRNQFNRLGVTLGATVLPTLRSVVSGMGSVVEKAAGLAEQFPTATKAVVGSAVGLIGMLGVLWSVRYAATLVGDAWDMGKVAVGRLGEAAKRTRALLVAFNSTALVTSIRTKALAVGGAIRSFLGLVGSTAKASGELIRFNAVALVTAARTKALAVGGAIKAFGSSLLGLATRAIPVAVVGLKALTVAALSNPFVLIGAAVVAVAVLVWKHWEPIKAFLIGLWPPIKAAFSVVWESIKFAFLNFHPLGLVIKHWEPIKAFFVGLWEWMKSAGAGLVSALVAGISSTPGRVYAAVKALLGPVGRLLPSSDAREGPLSGLTRRGRSIVSTLGEGVRRAGPRPLRRPLAATLSTAAAGLALTLPPLAAPTIPSPALPPLAAPAIPSPALPTLAAPVIPSPALPPLAAPAIPSPALPTPDSPPGRGVGEDSPRGPVINHYHTNQITNRITIHQQPGENAQALADRIIREIEQRQAQSRREELYDEVG